MKKIFSIVAGFCAGALILTSCGKEEQTSFNIDDITTYAKVTGVVNCNATDVFSVNGERVENPIKLAVGKTVYVVVPNDQYKDNAEGEKIFTGTIAEDGTYSISVPVAKATGYVVSVYAESFLYDVQENVKLDNNGNMETKTVKKLYKGTPVNNVALTPNVTEHRDLNYELENVEPEDRFKTEITLTGRVGIAAEKDSNTQIWKYTNDLKVLVTLYYNNGDTLKVNATTKDSGVWEVTVPMTDVNEILNGVEITGLAYAGNFTHYNGLTGKTLGGYYEAEKTTISSVTPVFVPGFKTDLDKKYGSSTRLKFYFNHVTGDEGTSEYDKNDWYSVTKWEN